MVSWAASASWIEKLWVACCLLALPAQAASPPMAATLENLVITIKPFELEDYDQATLRCDLTVINKGQAPISLRMGNPYMIAVYRHDGNSVPVVVDHYEVTTVYFGDGPKRDPILVLGSNASYTYKQVSGQFFLRRTAKAAMGLHYGPQEISFLFRLTPPKSGGEVILLRTQAVPVKLERSSYEHASLQR